MRGLFAVHKLDPNPPTIRNLLNEDLFRLERQYNAKDLPRDPWKCRTCGGKKTFMWYNDEGNVAEHECDCLAQYQLRLTLLNAGIDWAYQGLSLRDIEHMEQA